MMITQWTVLVTHLLLTVTPTLSASQCLFGTERFPNRSDCLALEDYCKTLNRILLEDGSDCGEKCLNDQKPSSDVRSCDQIFCRNSRVNCLPCPDGKVASEDGKSCLGQYIFPIYKTEFKEEKNYRSQAMGSV